MPEFGKYPVPDACCVEKTKYCGLKNDYRIFQRLPTRYNTTGLNMTDWNATMVPTTIPEIPVEISEDNIYIQGCYPKLGKVLSDMNWKIYFCVGASICTLDFMLLTLFGILLCFHSRDNYVSQQHVQYGRRKVPVSRRL